MELSLFLWTTSSARNSERSELLESLNSWLKNCSFDLKFDWLLLKVAWLLFLCLFWSTNLNSNLVVVNSFSFWLIDVVDFDLLIDWCLIKVSGFQEFSGFICISFLQTEVCYIETTFHTCLFSCNACILHILESVDKLLINPVLQNIPPIQFRK